MWPWLEAALYGERLDRRLVPSSLVKDLVFTVVHDDVSCLARRSSNAADDNKAVLSHNLGPLRDLNLRRHPNLLVDSSLWTQRERLGLLKEVEKPTLLNHAVVVCAVVADEEVYLPCTRLGKLT